MPYLPPAHTSETNDVRQELHLSKRMFDVRDVGRSSCNGKGLISGRMTVNYNNCKIG